MTYDIFKRTAPAMPKPGKGTEIVKLLLSQVSKEMQEPLLPMTIPALSAHVADVEFKYCDNKYYELCGQMGHLIGPSGIGKDQLHDLIEAIMRSFHEHDELEYKKLENWQRQKTTKGANKDKPERPEVAIWFPPIDVTSAAFLQNALGLEKQGGRTQYLNLPEVEMVDGLSSGHKAIAIPSATLLTKKDKELLETLNVQCSMLNVQWGMFPDADVPGERLFLQLKEVLPNLVRHQLPQGCKDYSDYYLLKK